MSQHPLTVTTTPGTPLTTNHAGWDAARAGAPAWIIDNDETEENWFEYTRSGIEQMRYVRKCNCKTLTEGKTL